MAFQRFDLLVRESRDRSGNARFTEKQGLAQRAFVSYGNDAQERIYNRILQERSSLFIKENFLNTVANQAEYTLPTDIYLRHNIVKVDYSQNGNPINYSPLDLRTPRQEITVAGYPASYFLRNGKIVVSPMPSSGTTNGLRLNYQYTIPTLDIRRAQIASVTGVNPTLTSITLTDNSLLLEETEDDLGNGYTDYISVVTKDGVQTAENIPVVGYNSTTKVITCNHTLSSGEIVAANSYVVFGASATTHSELPTVCERYLVEYMALRAQVRDSNTESADTNPILLSIEKEILDAVAELEEDLVAIPILDYSMMDYMDR